MNTVEVVYNDLAYNDVSDIMENRCLVWFDVSSFIVIPTDGEAVTDSIERLFRVDEVGRERWI